MPEAGTRLVATKGPHESFLEPQSVPGGWLRMMSLEGQYPGGTTHLVTGPGVVMLQLIFNVVFGHVCADTEMKSGKCTSDTSWIIKQINLLSIITPLPDTCSINRLYTQLGIQSGTCMHSLYTLELTFHMYAFPHMQAYLHSRP